MNNFRRKFAIRLCRTNKFFPAVCGRNGRGGSHTEPEETDNPRLFKSARAAKIFISSWRQGKYIADRGMDAGTWDNPPEYYEDIRIIKIPERLEMKFEIVAFKLIEEDCTNA